MFYEKIIDRLNKLIEMGEGVLATKYTEEVSIGYDENYVESLDHVDDELFYQWTIRTMSFLNEVFGDENFYFQRFKADCWKADYDHSVRGQSILKSVKEDIEGGYLINLETLVAADIFTDFLEMAEHLVEQSYKDPAAMLVGAVLEDGLRKIAKNNNIIVKSNDDIGSLNSKLADKQIYSRLIQREVHVWNGIRNKADHAEFEEYNLDKVKEMLKGVRNFLGQYL